MEKRILVLDDDLDVLEIIESILTYEGFEVIPLGHTYNIFQTIDIHKPDIILLDFILKGITGGEICKQLKSSEKTKHIPIIIISAYKGDAESIRSFGSDHFIAKPFSMGDLLEGINTTLNKRYLLKDQQTYL